MGFPFFKINSKLKIEGFFSAFEHVISDEYFFAGEMHDFWEILFVEKGRVTVSADDRVYTLEEHDIIFHKPMELHKFTVENGATIFVMSFLASGEFLEFFNNRTIKLSNRQRELLFDIIKQLRALGTGSLEGQTWYLNDLQNDELLMQQIGLQTELLLLSLYKNSTCVDDLPANFETEIFKQTVHIMQDHVTKWISTAEIAEKLNISVSYLKKVFSKYAGLGIHKYFLRSKITYACRLLSEGKSVNEVAELLSFSSYNYFSIVFKRETGKTPSQFKNRNN